MSTANWKVTIVTELEPYDDLLAQTLNYIEKISQAAKQTVQAHYIGEGSELDMYFSVLRNELMFINRTREEIFKKMYQYKILSHTNIDKVKRKKKAIIPIVGQIYSFMFGLTTEKDLNDIRKAINNLSDNQQKMKHVVEEGLTIINKSKNEIKQNRERLNIINNGVADLYNRLNAMTNQTKQNYMKMNYLIYHFFQIEALVSNAQELVIELVHHYTELKNQIDLLSLGKVTPGVISPRDFEKTLTHIKNKLPRGLQLAIDPRISLWSLYQVVSASAIIIDNRLVTVLDIPLIDRKEKMDVYKVINLPLPNLKVKNYRVRNPNKFMVASYELESDFFAIDKSRTKYTLLEEKDIINCVGPGVSFCKFLHPLYPTNVNKFCVIALFMSNEKMIRESCITKIRTKGILPMAKIIRPGLWAVTLREKLVFTITCENNKTLDSVTQALTPPIDKIELYPGCVAYSTEIMLPNFNLLTSREELIPDFHFKIDNKSFELWEPFHDQVEGEDIKWDLSALEDVEELNMGELIRTLKGVQPTHVALKSYWTVWNTVITILIVGGVIALVVYCVIKHFKNRIHTPPVIINEVVKSVSLPVMEKVENKLVKRAISSSMELSLDKEHGHFNVYPRNLSGERLS